MAAGRVPRHRGHDSDLTCGVGHVAALFAGEARSQQRLRIRPELLSFVNSQAAEHRFEFCTRKCTTDSDSLTIFEKTSSRSSPTGELFLRFVKLQVAFLLAALSNFRLCKTRQGVLVKFSCSTRRR